MEYCLMARDDEKTDEDWEQIKEGKDEPDYACDKNPREPIIMMRTSTTL